MEKIKAKVGETFKIGKYKFIRFGFHQCGIAVVQKKPLFKSEFGPNNDLTKSDILNRLVGKYLLEIEREIGAENVMEFETDLISMDGSEKHGLLMSKVSLPTFDFYRSNRSVFEKHPVKNFFWLATPWETSEYTDDDWVAGVSQRNLISLDPYFHRNKGGVRPFLILKSDIFGS